jgi:hypothetical protein
MGRIRLLLSLSSLLLLFLADDLSKKRRGVVVVVPSLVVVEAFGVVVQPSRGRHLLYDSISKDKEAHTAEETAGASKIKNSNDDDQQQLQRHELHEPPCDDQQLQQLHPVLRNLLPHLDRHQELYGNANIPL